MNASPWGGSEELWSRTAIDLARQGVPVVASVAQWSPPHERIHRLLQAGIKVQQRPQQHAFWMRAIQKLTSPGKEPLVLAIEKLVRNRAPALVVLSSGSVVPPIELVELCKTRDWPFVTIGQANSESWWPDDELAERYRKALPTALRCFFVSHANRSLAEKQLGCKIANVEVVRNPFNVEHDIRLPWPPSGKGCELRFACVARLDPPSKGQDILLEALARPQWSDRNWRLSIFGEGPARRSLELLARHLGLSERVVFAGFASVESIWASHHVLVMPSRLEGLPLAMVEAMWCARPVIGTNVAGNAEIIEDGINGFLAGAPTVSCMSDTLERAWARRAEFQQIGIVAANRIRELVPPDPTAVFSKILNSLAVWN
jgi:glycosyltransferase involved in cell wall biosynthesis